MHDQHTLPLILTVRAPFLSQGTAVGDLEQDAVALRANKRVIIPGSQIKGLLLDAWRQLEPLGGDMDHLPAGQSVAEWLGSSRAGSTDENPERTADPSNRPARGRLRFSDFEAQEDATGGHRYRVAIDQQRGSVSPMMLASVETPFPPGMPVTLKGSITFVSDVATKTRIEDAVRTGLRFVTHVGALRGQGFGRLVDVSLRQTTSQSLVSPPSERGAMPAAEYLDLAWTTDDPLLVSQMQPNTNLFESGPVVPGAVLKGALASSWRELLGKAPSGAVEPDLDPDRPTLAEHFGALRFTHAFLGDECRPVVLPHSIVVVGSRSDSKFFDLALVDGPCLIDSEAPKFQIDWKPETTKAARKQHGWPEPSYRMRVRAAMDPETRRSAEGKLFAHRALELEAGQRLYGRADLTAIADPSVREHAMAELQSLLAGGLRHVSKTKASLELDPERSHEVQPKVTKVSDALRASGDPLVMVLQTPALIADPQALDEASDVAALRAAYTCAFSAMATASGCHERLSLVRYFTVERLAGGEYYRRRFQVPNPYHPYLLTDAGSVFVFERTDAAAACLATWERRGLPLPPWAVERYAARVAGEMLPGDHWQRCPFLPTGGYGEIAVDLALHWQQRPTAHQTTTVPLVVHAERESSS